MRTLERALDYAEPDGQLIAFALVPATDLLDRYLRGRTAHASLLSQIAAFARTRDARDEQAGGGLREPLTESEVRVLRYLPTHLSDAEIANELFLSVNTVNTHIRHVYDKLGVHRRTDAVARAQVLRLRSPEPRG
jgi:LuxR family transcriptional regulator, maltose regulon positive regulatory protein